MPKKSLLSLPVALGIGVTLLLLALFVCLNHSLAADAAFVSAADLQKAGYTQVKQIAPTAAGRFAGPNLYFSVSDKVSDPNSEAPNVAMAEDFTASYDLSGVTLYNYGADSQTLSVSGGTGQVATLADGRVAINFIKNNHYDVVIAPNRVKAEALASIMAAKIQ